MTSSNPNKQYGLIVPNKNKGHQIGQITSKPSIFNDDSDSDTPIAKPTGITKGIRRQDKLDQEKAVEDDPTVYQYDEIYDEMDQKRKESKLSRKDLDRKPKYINRLLAAAEKRKRENERRIERQVQKEREEEGEMYKDKESFITSAYKKKLEEMRELEEQEKREEYLENIGDVRKQGNLDGFYRHLYDQKLNYEDKADDDTEPTIIKKEPNSDSESTKRKPSESEESSSNIRKKRKSSASESNVDNAEEGKDTKQRKYRARRRSEESEKSEEEVEVKKEHLPSNLDADSDFSIDSSDSEEEKENVKKQDKNTEEKTKNKEIILEEKKVLDEMKEGESESVKTEEKQVKNEPEEKIVKPKKPKVDIWKKVTVGEKFDEAVKRYYERKAQREMEGKSF